MKKKKSGCGRVLMSILCVLLGLVLVVAVGGTIYANRLLNLLSRPDDGPQETLTQEQIQQIIQEETIAPDETTAPDAVPPQIFNKPPLLTMVSAAKPPEEINIAPRLTSVADCALPPDKCI